VLLLAMLLAGCADRTIRLTYAPPAPTASLRSSLVIVPFQDRRGDEGDAGDASRVGGIYTRYGNRLAKVMVTEPWPPVLVSALVAEFRARGIAAIAADRPSTAVPVVGAYTLEGDVRNFSTESRWSRQAHISAVIRLLTADGRAVVQKRISVREKGFRLNTFNTAILETLLNRAFARFVAAVADDPDIRSALEASR
jgi:uncharacterized lipoprotein YajG